MIYFIFACFLVFFVCSWRQIRKVDKHDRVLFDFCKLRREIMTFRYDSLVENSKSLSCEDSKAIRRLSRVLDATIHGYNEHKILTFNLRKIARYLKQYRHTLNQAEPINITDNVKIREFHARFVLCFAKAFLDYTPLIRSELTLRLIAFAYRKQSSRYVMRVAKQVRDDRHRFDLSNSGAVA